MSLTFGRLSKTQQAFIQTRLDAAGVKVDVDRPRTKLMQKLNEAIAENTHDDRMSHKDAREAIRDVLAVDSRALGRSATYPSSVRALLAADDVRRERVFGRAFGGRPPAGTHRAIGEIECYRQYTHFTVEVDQIDDRSGKIVDYRQVVVDFGGNPVRVRVDEIAAGAEENTKVRRELLCVKNGKYEVRRAAVPAKVLTEHNKHELDSSAGQRFFRVFYADKEIFVVYERAERSVTAYLANGVYLAHDF